MTKESIQTYRPALAAFLTMMTLSILTTVLGFFQEPICQTLDIGRGRFSIIFSLMSITGAVTTPWLGTFLGEHGPRRLLLWGGFWTGCCLMALAWVQKLWMLYALGFCMGVFSNNYVALCANDIVQRQYSGAKASGILGMVMAGSGAGGVIFSLVIPGCMTRLGWQWGAVIMGLIWWGVLWLAAVLLGKEQTKVETAALAESQQGMTRAEALKTPQLYKMMAVTVIVCAACGVQQQLPALLAGFEPDSGKVSVMISVSTAFLAVGKILQGLLYGKLGMKKGGTVTILAFAAGMLAMIRPEFAWPGLALLSVGFGIYSTLLSQVTRQIFGTREYAAIWSLITAVGSVGTILANPIWGSIYDHTGTYIPGLVACAGLLAVAVLILRGSVGEVDS